MAYSYNVYTGNGSTTQFTIGFSYIRREHVKVYVAFVDTAYTYVNNTTVQLATAPGAGVRVEVRRVTPAASPLVDFADGSTLVAADLDTSNLQHLYLEQELDDSLKQTVFVDPATGLLTAANQRITNVADPTSPQDAATKAYTDAADALRLKRDGTQAMTGALPMGGFKVTGLGTATLSTDATTKAYVDAGDSTLTAAAAAAQATANAALPKAGGTMTGSIVFAGAQPTATTAAAGIVQLTDSTSSTSTTTAATPAAVKVAKDAADAAQSTANTANTTANAALPKAGGTMAGAIAFDLATQQKASTSTYGITQLTNSTTSTDTGTAATAASAKAAADLANTAQSTANAALPKAGGTMTGAIVVPVGSAAAPSVSFTSDVDTGIFSGGAGQFNVAVNGSTKLEINTTTNTFVNSITHLLNGNDYITFIPGGALTVDNYNTSTGLWNGYQVRANNHIFSTTTSGGVGTTFNRLTIANSGAVDIPGALTAGTITGPLTGAASDNVLKAGDTMTGVLAVTAGTAALPGIAVSGDPNTGIYSPGANQLAISTNGTGRLFVDANGNVGIGAAPSPWVSTVLGPLQIGALGSAIYQANSITPSTFLTTNYYIDSISKSRYISIGVPSPATMYRQLSGFHTWYASPFGRSIPVSSGIAIGAKYTVTTLGSTTLAEWQVLFNTLTVLPTVNQSITATASGTLAGSPAATVTQEVVLTEVMSIDSAGTTTLSAAAATAPFIAKIGGSEITRIDSSGRILQGTSSAWTNLTPARVNIASPGASTEAILNLGNFSASVTAPIFGFYKSRSTTAGGFALVSNGDGLGSILFSGSDGFTSYNSGAAITCIVDGTSGTYNIPGRLVFSTTLAGSGGVTSERFRITNDGVRCYRQAAPATYAAAATLTVADLKTGIITYTGTAATLTLPTGTLTEGGFSGIYTNMTFEWSVINTGAGVCTVDAGTDHTIVGSGTIAIGASARFASQRTAANTFVSYRLS